MTLYDPHKNLNEIFNIESVALSAESMIPEIIDSELPDILKDNPIEQVRFSDSQKIRNTLEDTLDKAQRALDAILSETEANPLNKNAGEVAKLADSISKLIGILSDLNYREMEISLKRKGKEAPSESAHITNNTIIMSSSELLDKIAKRLGR